MYGRMLFASCLVTLTTLAACSGSIATPPGDDITLQDAAGADSNTQEDSATLRDGSVTPPPKDGGTPDATIVPPPPPQPRCTVGESGLYCGNPPQIANGNPATLYRCSGVGPAAIETACPMGCSVNPPGVPDSCKSENTYRLPWPNGRSMQLTQDCNDSCCADHVGTDQYAWDWGTAGAFPVVAARSGIITHLKINSNSGCGNATCAGMVNYVVVDHGDGTQATYMHLAYNSLGANIRCGMPVKRGQVLAQSGSTGWSTGNHLHFQVNAPRPGANKCACGADGLGCNANVTNYNDFWVTAAQPSKAIAFEEWQAASSCNDRRQAMPGSTNVAP
jgi:hypothetical protein